MTGLATRSTARQRCEEALARAAEPSAHATILTVTTQRARAEAARSDERRRRGAVLGPLDGVPIVWKDLFDVVGTTTTRGSAVFAGEPAATSDSALVRRARALGMVTIGKTNLSELAFSGLGVNLRFGTPANPLDEAVVPGGSSSGSAVAVATGIVPVAVGTDTSGSVRVPAAFTGCVGFRASQERYGRNDFRALSATLDSVGILARSVADIAALDRSLTAWSHVASTTIRVIVPAGEWIQDCTPGVRAAFEFGIRTLRAGGVDIRTAPLASLQRAQELIDKCGTIVGADAFAAYGDLAADPTGIEAATRRRLLSNSTAGRTIGPLRAAMAGLRHRLRTELAGAILACPTVRHEPPRIIDVLGSPERYDAANASTLRTTMVLSYLGTCGISLPIAGAAGAAPSGLLLSAPEGHDHRLLAAASTVERMLRPQA